MAIEITTFNYPNTYSQNILEVYDWLIENASEYFPGGFTKNTSAYFIYCMSFENDDETGIRIPFYSTSGNIRPKYATENAPICPNGITYRDASYTKAIKTSCGIMLVGARDYSPWVVARTTEGTVCTFAVGSTAIGQNILCYRFADLERSRVATTYEPGMRANIKQDLYNGMGCSFKAQPVTALLPIVYDGGTYSTDLCLTPFTQYREVSSSDFYYPEKVLIDGEEYVSDGFIALRG